jgi:hypothetical protein
MGTFSRSISLVKASWGVLRQDKELILLPAISSITSMLCVAPFFAAAFLLTAEQTVTSTTTQTGTTSNFTMSPVGYVFLFIAYLIGAYVTIFFQTALVLAANDRLTGGSPTLGTALAGAWSNAGRILPWAIISATVSVVLQAIQERAGIIGRIVIGIVGLAWTLVTLLVLPILVIEQVGVKEAFTRSATAFKKTWGENVVGNGGIGVVVMLIMLGGLLVLSPVLIVGISSDSVPVIALGALLLLIWVILVSVFGAALNGVFRTALYRYAVLGEEPAGFSHDQIAGAFKPKKKGMLGSSAPAHHI